MAKLFQKKDPSELRSKRVPLLLTEKEHLQIGRLAKVRNLDVSEFIRRAALGRKADVDHETQIVLALSDVTRSIRGLHAALVEHGAVPLESQLLPVILDAREAILRISK